MTARQGRIDHLIHSLTVMMLVANADGVCERKPTPNAGKSPPPLTRGIELMSGRTAEGKEIGR
jgi:hypothetical protein